MDESFRTQRATLHHRRRHLGIGSPGDCLDGTFGTHRASRRQSLSAALCHRPAGFVLCANGRRAERQRRSSVLVGHPDEEQPRIDYATEKTRPGGRDEPIQTTTGLEEEGEPCYAYEHGRRRIRGESFDVAEDALV